MPDWNAFAGGLPRPGMPPGAMGPTASPPVASEMDAAPPQPTGEPVPPLDPVLAEIAAQRGHAPQELRAPQAPPVSLGLPPLQVAQRTVTGDVYNPDDVRRLLKAMEASGDVQQQKARDDEDRANALADVYAEQTLIRSRSYEQAQAMAAEHQRRLDEAATKADTAAKAASEATIEPGRFWARKSTGEKILAALSMALGAFGSALTRTPNAAMEIINAGIAEDLEAQRSEIAGKRLGADAAQNAYARMRQQGFDEASTALALEKQGLERVDAKLREMMARMDSGDAKTRGEAMRAQINEKIAEVGMQLRAQRSMTVYARPAPVGMSLADEKTSQEILLASPAIKDMVAARKAKDRWHALRKSGAGSAAIVDFVAQTLGQGSISESFVSLLRERGWINDAGQFLRDQALQNYDEKLADKLEKSLDEMTAQADARAMPVLDRARARGVDPDAILGGPGEYQPAGAVPVNR